MNLIKKSIYNFLRLFRVNRILNSLNDYDNIQNCYRMTKAANAIFYRESEIDNLQNNPFQIQIEKNTHIRGKLLVFSYGGKITIGENSYLGKDSNIWSAKEIIIGNNVLISHNVNIVDTNSHEIDHLERADSFNKMVRIGHPSQNIYNVPSDRIIIEDYVWISFNVTILKGVKIGKGAIIAAGSVVTKDVEPFTMIGGNTAKLLKRLKE